jgi:molybdopterin molybdotransferase
MLTLQEARERIYAALQRAERSERIPLIQASGRFIAEEIRARVDNPAFTNSAMDGYAINTADAARHGHILRLDGEASAGSAPGTLTPGTVMRIFTGAPVPVGADAVVMQEDVKVTDGRVQLPPAVKPGECLRHAGEDFRAGDILYRPGQRLTSLDLALISSAGVPDVAVYQRPRALVIATGDELVAPGEALKPGQIYESNRLATLVALQALGADVTDGGTVRDDADALRARLAQATDYDFVVTSGGASVGDRDLVKQIFTEIGEINLWKIKIKPGKPLAFGRVGSRGHFFALPGNPVSSLVTFKLFVEPALIAWHHGEPESLALKAVAANGFQRTPGRMEFLRARLYDEQGTLKARVLRGQGSHMLAPLRETNAFIRLNEESTGFEAGAQVDVFPLRLS